MRGVLVIALIVTLLFAGCTAPNEVTERPQVDSVDLPAVWETGQWWTYDTNAWGEVTFVVFSETDDRWRMETTNGELSWIDGLEPTAFLGNVRHEDLAISQDGPFVRYFDFPLEKGKSWEIRWDGERRTVTVEDVSDVALLAVHSGDRLIAEYTYDPRVGWFTEYETHDGTGSSLTMSLVDHGQGFEGAIVDWEGIMLNGWGGGAPMGTAISEPFATTSDMTDLWFRYQAACAGTTGTFTVTLSRIAPMPEDEFREEGVCEDRDTVHIVSDPGDSEWVVTSGFLVAGSIEDLEDAWFIREAWGRTMHKVPVGS